MYNGSYITNNQINKIYFNFAEFKKMAVSLRNKTTKYKTL